MIDDKILAVITSCTTDSHFKCSVKYIKLALKSNLIDEKLFNMMVGVIATMRAFKL